MRWSAPCFVAAECPYLVLAHLESLVEHGVLRIHLLQVARRVAVQLHAVWRRRHWGVRLVHVGRLGEGRHAVLLEGHAELEEAALGGHAVGVGAVVGIHVPLRLRCAGRASAIAVLVRLLVLLVSNLRAEGVVQVLDVELVGELLELLVLVLVVLLLLLLPAAVAGRGAVSELGKVQVEVQEGAEVVLGAGHVELLGARPCWRRSRGSVHTGRFGARSSGDPEGILHGIYGGGGAAGISGIQRLSRRAKTRRERGT